MEINRVQWGTGLVFQTLYAPDSFIFIVQNRERAVHTLISFMFIAQNRGGAAAVVPFFFVFAMESEGDSWKRAAIAQARLKKEARS